MGSGATPGATLTTPAGRDAQPGLMLRTRTNIAPPLATDRPVDIEEIAFWFAPEGATS